jgi:hypothetical protein
MAGLSAVSRTDVEFKKIGINASYESNLGHFWITHMAITGYSSIVVASLDIPTSNALSYTYIKVEPPRNFENFRECGCPLFCYEN